MLPPSFLDWWFAPWTYAPHVRHGLPVPADQVAQRDSYRYWCTQAGVVIEFPASFDPGWHVATVDTAMELSLAARLFAGLIASRDQNQALLGQLAVADRRWCMGVATTQPLSSCRQVPFAPTESIEIHGLVELTRRLEHGFPGMWSRLRLLLPDALAARTGELLKIALASEDNAGKSVVRAQRCWMLCRGHAAAACATSAGNAAESRNGEEARPA